MDVKSKFALRELDEKFPRRGTPGKGNPVKDKAHNNRHGPDRQRSRPYREQNRKKRTRKRKQQKQDRSGKKRTTCIQCHEKRALTNLEGWSKQLCTTCARKANINFPSNKIKKRTGRVSENAAEGDCLKRLRRFGEKRKKIWRSPEVAEDFENSEFPEDAEDSEAQLSEENASEQDLPTP